MIDHKTFQNLNSFTATSSVVQLNDDQSTTVHMAKYDRSALRPKIVLFDQPTKLLDWCNQHNYQHAINGGFFVRSTKTPLGEMWLDGKEVTTEQFPAPWNVTRGCVVINDDLLSIAPRDKVEIDDVDDLMQAGPTLISGGISTYSTQNDPDGFSETNWQHDEDINIKRYPRAAIACNDTTVWTVTVDGRNSNNAGMYLGELAELLLQLGAKDAVNLDGGRSASHVHNGHLINHPRSDYAESLDGYEIYSAVVFK